MHGPLIGGWMLALGHEVYVRPFPNIDGGRWQLSTDGGTQPLWARDGIADIRFSTFDVAHR